MRTGKKKVLIGSTDKCGTGVNVQTHLDVYKRQTLREKILRIIWIFLCQKVRLSSTITATGSL